MCLQKKTKQASQLQERNRTGRINEFPKINILTLGIIFPIVLKLHQEK